MICTGIRTLEASDGHLCHSLQSDSVAERLIHFALPPPRQAFVFRASNTDRWDLLNGKQQWAICAKLSSLPVVAVAVLLPNADYSLKIQKNVQISIANAQIDNLMK